ncbi:MAG: UDP-4-amino-4-deoxy-L-arabinose aminotransferase [Phycisphaerae bacterium]|nr:UDP-4-amino-4-deoxy-L-arabinose aminotransferase [Phycisphaerae bacterium]
MRHAFLPFSRPSITEGDIEAVAQVLRSGWITTGPKASEFEQAFSHYTGACGSVAVASATAGMHVMLAALGIGPGDEVITPSMTWVSTVNLITLAGATPVFADIDRDTLMVSARTIEPCLSSRTRLIVPVHFAGSCVDMDPIRNLARDKGVALVEDAAHAAGTQYNRCTIGRTGTAIFSFHPIKNLTTGEGGMVCSDDPDLLDRIKRLKFHGLGVDAFDRTMQGRSPQAQVLEPGYKYNLTDMAAVLGLGQLARLDAMNQRRRVLAECYQQHLMDIDEVMPLAEVPHCTRHAWHLFIVRIDTDRTGMSRDEFMARLKALNIGTGLHFRAVHQQKYFAETLGLSPGSLPNTEWNSDRICSLPLCPDMTEEDVLDVVEAVKAVLSVKC